MCFNILTDASLCVIDNVYEDGNAIPTLIDTGANMPVWCNGMDTLLSTFPKTIQTDLYTTIFGYGSDGVRKVPVCIIPEFKLSDGNESVTFTQLHVAVNGMSADFKMIMSFNMLNHANTTYSSHKIGKTLVRTIDIKYDKEIVMTTKVKTAFGSNEVSEISVNAQADVGGVERTLDEIRGDSFFYAEASSYGVDPMDVYTLLSVVVKDKTTMSNLEIIEKLNELVRSGS